MLDETNRGITDSQVLVGLAYDKGDEEMNVSVDYSKAFMWYLKAAMQNNVHGQYCLAMMYVYGAGVDPDLKTVTHWLKKAAALDNMYAMHFLGTMYENGDGVERKYTEAYNWFERAAMLDYEDAQKKIKNWK